MPNGLKDLLPFPPGLLKGNLSLLMFDKFLLKFLIQPVGFCHRVRQFDSAFLNERFQMIAILS